MPVFDDTPAGRTFLELQNRALHDDFSPIKYREFVKDTINDALHEIFRTTRLAEGDNTTTITTIAGIGSYDLPGDSIRVDSLRATGVSPNRPLSEITQDDLDALASQSGPPDRYALTGGDVLLYPTPAGVEDLELRYRWNPASMVADDEQPALPGEYRNALWYHARAELFALEDDRDMEAFWRGKRDDVFRKIRADVQRRSRRVRRVPSMWACR